MADVALKSQVGEAKGTVNVPDEVFGIEPNVAVMHQVVVAQLAAARSGTHSTKTRAEVRGGGAKPWRQKGTGRARAGSIRSPLWVGGGRSHGPKPRDYGQRTPKKMKTLALRSALSDRVATKGLIVVDEWQFDSPKTREAVEALESLGLDGKSVLLVAADAEAAVAKSFRNLPEVSVIVPGELNTYDILRCEFLLVSLETLKLFAGGEASVSEAKQSSKAKTAPKKDSGKKAAAEDDSEEKEGGDSE
ncbi:MAG: 50S ribosomal protein L4 [Acidobacteria bacterium]|nr:MAG: 50S ribosomal protein L4 [Acidobacteriota bacterium]